MNYKGIKRMIRRNSAVHAKGLRRSKRVVNCSCEIYAKENDEEEEKEEVLNSSHQSTSTTHNHLQLNNHHLNNRPYH
ncbi:hypothetical protein C1645_816791 [Glomus cerebriforme]|uniref:Uncharacterized protein n=1 Tax=Glomus cerebriforme TaxID=658196 RepID=A0A397TJX6_9GLOM|nr:hypothetical protein C1645_816791 [Glomus cerebriforme]